MEAAFFKWRLVFACVDQLALPTHTSAGRRVSAVAVLLQSPCRSCALQLACCTCQCAVYLISSRAKFGAQPMITRPKFHRDVT